MRGDPRRARPRADLVWRRRLWVANSSAPERSRASISGSGARGARSRPSGADDGRLPRAGSSGSAPRPRCRRCRRSPARSSAWRRRTTWPRTPAHNWDEQVLYATCAKLLNYPDSAGPAGAQLRPEVAAAMPTVSPDGAPTRSASGGLPLLAALERGRDGADVPAHDRAADSPSVGGRVGRPVATSRHRGRAGLLRRQGAARRRHRRSRQPAVDHARQAGGDFLTRIAAAPSARFHSREPVAPDGAAGRSPPPAPTTSPRARAAATSSCGTRTTGGTARGAPSASSIRRSCRGEGGRARRPRRGRVPCPSGDATCSLRAARSTAPRRGEPRRTCRPAAVLPRADPFVDYFVFNTPGRSSATSGCAGRSTTRSTAARSRRRSATPRPIEIVPPAVAGFPAGRIFPFDRRRGARARSRAAEPPRGPLYCTNGVCGDAGRAQDRGDDQTDLARIRIRRLVLEDGHARRARAARPEERARGPALLVNGWPRERDPQRSSTRRSRVRTAVRLGARRGLVERAGVPAATRRDAPLRGASAHAGYRRTRERADAAAPARRLRQLGLAGVLLAQVGCKVFQADVRRRRPRRALQDAA